MAGSETIGTPLSCNLERTEGDTDDIVFHFKDSAGADADVTGWTAVLSIGQNNDTPLSPAKTYPGVGISGGLLPIDMDGFDVPIGSYVYDLRVTDTVTLDAPVRVYAKGKFKVTARID
jgi:hypothetical protein